MHLILTVAIGFLAGLVARWITPGCGPSGFIRTMLLGIAGALAAGFIRTMLLGIAGALAATVLGQLLHWYRPGQSAGFIGAVVGAILLLASHHLTTMRER